MSFLRIRSPYHEPRDIWLGPNHAHVSARGGIRGGLGNPVVYGTLAVGVSAKTQERQKRLSREAKP